VFLGHQSSTSPSRVNMQPNSEFATYVGDFQYRIERSQNRRAWNFVFHPLCLKVLFMHTCTFFHVFITYVFRKRHGFSFWYLNIILKEFFRLSTTEESFIFVIKQSIYSNSHVYNRILLQSTDTHKPRDTMCRERADPAQNNGGGGGIS